MQTRMNTLPAQTDLLPPSEKKREKSRISMQARIGCRGKMNESYWRVAGEDTLLMPYKNSREKITKM